MLQFVSTMTGKLEHETRRHRLGTLAVMCIRFNPVEQHLCLAGTSIGRVYSVSIKDAHVEELIHGQYCVHIEPFVVRLHI